MTMPCFSKPNSQRTTYPRTGVLFPDIFPSGRHYVMRSDVKETDTMYQLDIDLPGFQKENIKAYVENGYLIVEAAKNKESGEDSKHCTKKYMHKERYEGTYRRTFYVGSNIHQEDIKATYRHGVLHLHIPKKPIEEKTDVIAIS